MDRRLLLYFDRELHHLETVGKEFAREHPKIASRLALDSFPCVDPYVERLLEGFAFLAARVHLKLDAEFPRFTHNLLETIYPHYLAPTPSMCVTHFKHDPGEAGLVDGHQIPRGTVLRSHPNKDISSCEFRTAHPVTLYPIEVEDVRYFTRDVGTLELQRIWGAGEEYSAYAPRGSASALVTSTSRGLYLGSPGSVKAAIRIRLRTTAGVPFKAIKAKDLVFHLRGSKAIPYKVYEQLFAHAKAVIVRPVPQEGAKLGTWQENIGPSGDPITIQRRGFNADDALLPYDARSFQGYRLLHEYFAFPQRFLFVSIGDISTAFAKCTGQHLDIIIPLSEESEELEGKLDADSFTMHCTPAINVFPKRADRIFVEDNASEFHIIADRTKPLDYEVYSVKRVTGFAAGGEEREFRPFYAATDSEANTAGEAAAYYSVHRVPRALSEREQREGTRTKYTGSDTYLSLVDARNAPYAANLRQLAVETLCTNRDVPLQMPLGKGRTDFMPDVGGPIVGVRVLDTVTRPRASYAEGDASWRLISHLTLNYLSINDEDVDKDGRISPEERQGANALREILKLYSNLAEPSVRQQVEGIKQVQTRPITRRVPAPGVVAFARGLEVSITLDEMMFSGSGAFLLGSVLDHFFARYASMNSFTECVINSDDRGEIMRWPARVGDRPVL
jgi:type VI secretion system protein ImpG